MSYVNKIGGNEIIDSEARKKLDDLRAVVNSLSYAVDLLKISISSSTFENGNPRDYYNRNKTGSHANAVNFLSETIKRTSGRYFANTEGKNIL